MPFLVDSIRMVINRMGLASHLIIHMGGIRVKRDKQNHVTADFTSKRCKLMTRMLSMKPLYLWKLIDKLIPYSRRIA